MKVNAMFPQIIAFLYRVPIFEQLFHTSVYCLKRELADCRTVLDLGCGQDSPIQNCSWLERTVGVESFGPYLERSRANGIHTEYIQDSITNLSFPPDSFDAVILIEVIEHMEESMGRELLEKAAQWARKKIILTTPNGYFPMEAVDGNPHQQHLSGWTVPMLKGVGFQCHGLVGIKLFFQQQHSADHHGLMDAHDDDVFSNIRFRPKKLFYFINALCQIFSYYFPNTAFGLFAVRGLDKS